MLDQTAGTNSIEALPVSPEEDDISLAFQAGQGDQAAYAKLYERHLRRTRSICLRMMHDESDADDLAQEVWIQIFRKITQFKGESSFTTWLHRTTVNQVLMHFRKRWVKYEQIMDDPEKMPEEIVSGSARPDRMRVMEHLILKEAMDGLPKGYHDAIVYHDILGFEHEEIAVLLGSSVGTSKSQLHKARVKLQKLLSRRTVSHEKSYAVEKRVDAKRGIMLPAVDLKTLYELADEAEDIEQTMDDIPETEGDYYDFDDD